MEYLKLIIDACISIWNYSFSIFGYTFTLMQVAMWVVVAAFLLWFIPRVFD